MFILFSDIFDCKIVESDLAESKSSAVEDTSIVNSTKVDDNVDDYFDLNASLREIITADKDFDLFLEKDAELNYTDTDPSENKAGDEGLETCSPKSNQDVSDVIVQDKNNIHVASTGEKTYVTDTGKHFPIKKQSALSKTKSPSPKTVRRLKKSFPSEEPCTSISPPVPTESKKIKSVVKRIYNKIAEDNASRKETDDGGSAEKIARKRTRSKSRSRSSSISDKRDKRSESPYQCQSSSSHSRYYRSTSPDKSYTNRKDRYSYSEEDRYQQQQQDYYHYQQHRQQCPKVNDTLCDLYDFQQDIQNTYRLFLRYPCLADTVLKDNQYLIAQRNKTLYENLPDIIEHCCEFKATMQLNQLTDKEKILFFRYILQVITLGVAYRKYVFLDAHDRVNMGQPLPDFAKMLNITDVELELMVKQMFSFAQRATNIALPTEKECFSRQDQKQYQYKKNFHSGDNYDNQYYDSDVRFTRRGGANNFGRFNNKRQQFHKGRGRGGGGGGGGSYNFYNQYPVQQSNESQKRYHDAYYTNRNNAEYTASYSTTTKYDQPSSSHQSWHNQSDSYSQKYAAYNCYGSYKTST